MFRLFIKLFLGSLCCLFACQSTPSTQDSPNKPLPNIIYILADDMGYGDMGAYNPESKIATPHLDQLAREGMRLTDAHAPGSVCSPTRYAILYRTILLAEPYAQGSGKGLRALCD